MSLDRMERVLVCGASGNQGGAVAKRLLERGHAIRILTRRAGHPFVQTLAGHGAEVALGDFDDERALAAALRDVDRVFLVGTPYEAGAEAEIRHGRRMIDAARDAGVGHLVYSSTAHADQATGIPHFDSKWAVETHLRASGLPWTVLGPAFFKENLLSPLWLPALQQGLLPLALPPERSLQMISRDEIAAFVVAAFEHPDAFVGMRLDIASDRLSGAETAERLARLSGRPIVYEQLPLSAMRALGEDFEIMFRWFDEVGYRIDIEQLRTRFPDIALSSFESWASRFDWPALLRPS